MFRFLVGLASTTLNVMLVLLFPVMLFIPARLKQPRPRNTRSA